MNIIGSSIGGGEVEIKIAEFDGLKGAAGKHFSLIISHKNGGSSRK